MWQNLATMKTKPTPIATDLEQVLADVVSQLKLLPPRDLDLIAASCKVTSNTVKNIRDERPSRTGPGYHVVSQIHAELRKLKEKAQAQ